MRLGARGEGSASDELHVEPSDPKVSERGLRFGAALGFVVGLWSTIGAWGARPPGGNDVMAHLVRIDFGIHELVTHGRLDGWLPRFYTGYQEFLVNGPGLVWATALVRLPTFGLLSDTGAFKVVGVLAFAATPVAVAFFARSLGLDRLASGVAAVLTLWVSNPFGPGLAGLYDIGLVSHQVGAVFFFVALGALIRTISDERARWVLLAAASLAVLAVTHLISVMILLVLFPLLAVGELWRNRRSVAGLGRLAVAGVLSAGLAGWWLLPLLIHRDLRGPIATWGTPPFGSRIDDIAAGRILLRPFTLWFVVAGWAYLLYASRGLRRFGLALVMAPIVYLVLAHWSASQWTGNEITAQLANRGLGYMGIVALLPLAIAIADGARRVARSESVAGALALVIAVGLVVSPLGPDRELARQTAEPVPGMRHAAEELARVVPDGARFATVRDYPSEIGRTGMIEPPFWLSQVSGRDSINGFNLEATSTAVALGAVDSLSKGLPEAAADQMVRLGVTHVVTTSDVQRGRLTASGRFALVWQQEPMAVLAVVGPADRPGPSSLLSAATPMTAALTDPSPEHLRFEATSSEPVVVTVAVAWSPKWKAAVDGRRADVTRTTDGLMQVALPAGSSTLELRYEQDGWDRLGLALTVMCLGATALWCRRRRRQRSTLS
ncbi:MAG: hypothetical protein QOK06_2424 [Acidimicrobiaceae bacterium]